MLYFLFFTNLIVGSVLFIMMLFIKREPANFILFLLFATLTLIIDAMFLLSLQNNEEELRIIAYIIGSTTIILTMLRFIAPNTNRFCKVMIVLLFSFSFCAAFFL